MLAAFITGCFALLWTIRFKFDERFSLFTTFYDAVKTEKRFYLDVYHQIVWTENCAMNGRKTTEM